MQEFSMNLDILGSIACLTVALAGAALNAISQHGLGWKLPGFVRRGVFVTCGCMVFRAVDLGRLALDGTADHRIGHIDAIGVIAGFSLAYTLLAMGLHLAWRARLRSPVRAR